MSRDSIIQWGKLRAMGSYNQLKQRNKEDILISLIQIVHKSSNLQEIYRVALDSVIELENVDMALIYLVDEEKREAVLQAHKNVSEDYIRRAGRIPYPKGVTWKVINTGRTLNVEDVQKDPDIGPAGRDLGRLSVLGIPIILEEKVIGVIWFVSYKGRKFNQREVNLLSTLGDQIGTAIAKAKMFKEMEQQAKVLYESKERYRILVENMHDLICEINFGGHLLYLSPNHKKILGYEPSELLGRSALELVHPGDLFSVIAEFKKGIETHSLRHTVFRYRHKNGQWRWLESIATGFQTATGEIRWVIASRDITERKQAEEALRESEKQYRDLFENVPTGVYRTTPDGRILMANPALVRTLGYFSFDELASRNLEKEGFESTYPRSQFKELLGREGEVIGLESPWIRRDTSVIFVRESTRAIRGEDGTVLYYEGTVEDITERRRAEEALLKAKDELEIRVVERTTELINVNERLRLELTERKRMEEELLKAQKLESIGVLAGGIAHDFNNILTAILGNVSLTKMHVNPEDKMYKRLTEAEKACLRAKDLTQQLLTFSKGGAPVKKLTSIGELIKNSASFALIGSNVRCEFSIPEDLWLVEFDEGQISQVIHNLVINAEQAMPEGGVIRVRAENVSLGVGDRLPEGRYVKITAEDEGIGIAKEHLSKIFDPYFTTKQKGSGLGLATAYSIIKSHDGYIEVESELEVGTKLYIYLPATQGISEKRKQERVIGGKGKILVMDDEEMIREIAGEMVRHIGYDVECARNGEEAIELYRRAKESNKPFDIVIMDLTIPGGIGGKEAITRLLEIDPGIKAIVSSGYSNDPVMSEYRKYGFRGVIAKPYKIQELSTTLHNTINEE